MRGKIRRNGILALVFALCLTMFSNSVSLRADTAGSVTFTYEGMADCTFSMYYVADYSTENGYRLASAFADTSMSRTDLEDGKWYSLAMTLETLVVSEQISAAATGQTDSNGVVAFTGLAEGLYLVTIERMTVNQTVYTAQPLLIMVPDYNSDGTANYNEDITVTKYETSEVQEKTSVSVQKVWDDDNSGQRPTSITVYLLKGSDGTIADTQTLDDSDNWRYTWSDLDGSEVWYVVEEDMTEYGVSYSSADDGTIVITNQQGSGRTHPMGNIPVEDSEDSEIYDSEDTENPVGTEETEISSSEEESDYDSESGSIVDSEDMIYQEIDGSEDTEPEGPEADSEDAVSQNDSSDKLPQTGLKWWTFLFLIAAAAICFIIGGARKNNAAANRNNSGTNDSAMGHRGE